MATLRRAGTCSAFTYSPQILDPQDPGFPALLSGQRFRTIDLAASEEVSAGWVTPQDPTGDSHDLQDLDAGGAAWLRVRVDRKKLPAAVWQRELAVAERARGKRLSARERRELRDDVHERFLPRAIPSTTNIDALLFRDRRLVLVWAAGKSARETFRKLFFASFGSELQLLDGLQLGMRELVDDARCDALERLEPTRWPSEIRRAAGGAS